MKRVLMLILMVSILTAATIGCLMMFGVFSVDRGLGFMLNALAVIGVIGLSTLVLAFFFAGQHGLKNTEFDSSHIDMDP